MGHKSAPSLLKICRCALSEQRPVLYRFRHHTLPLHHTSMGGAALCRIHTATVVSEAWAWARELHVGYPMSVLLFATQPTQR